MARAFIDIADDKIQMLDQLAVSMQISRAALVRLAIDQLLHGKKQQQQSDVFGIWSGRQIDSLKFQNKLRSEW